MSDRPEMRPRKVSRYLVATDPFQDPADGQEKRVIFGTRRGVWKAVEEAEWKAIQALSLGALPINMVDELINNEILVPAEEDELAAIVSGNQESISGSDELYLVVQPTDSCQLGCDYCGQSHGRQRLGQEHQEMLVERVREKLSRSNFRSVRVAWFGAEPLAALRVMRELSQKLIDLAEAAGCSYSALVVTNGLSLSSRVQTELCERMRVNLIEVTLDGDLRFHDARRGLKTGRPSFEIIYRNISELALRRDLKVDVRIRCNVDRRNREGVLPLIERLAADGLADKISFYVAPIHAWGNNADELLDIRDFAAWQIEWFAHLLRLEFRPKLLPGRLEVVCMAVQPHSDLVDASGTLFNCTEVSYVPTYEGESGAQFAKQSGLTVAETIFQSGSNIYAVGSLRDGDVDGARDLLGNFNQRVVEGQYPCSQCELFPTCGGRCPKLWLEGTTPCPPEKYNMEQRLMLAYIAQHPSMRVQSVGKLSQTEALSTDTTFIDHSLAR